MTRLIFFVLDCLSSSTLTPAKKRPFLGKSFLPPPFPSESKRFSGFCAFPRIDERETSNFHLKSLKANTFEAWIAPESTPLWKIHQKWKTNYSDFRFGGRAFCAFINWKSRVQWKAIINNAQWLGKVGIPLHALPLWHFPTSIRGDNVVNQLSCLLRRDKRYWKGWKREWLSHHWFYESFEAMTDGFNVSTTCARI